tara:strand:- start:2260 stop:3615 length:1356 start_codon:yes stop_codon:yes gene_type:complete
MNLEATKRIIQLNPVNATSSGVYAPSSGLPLIKFDISSFDNTTFLDCKNLRISGKITYKVPNGTAPLQGSASFVDGFCGTFGNCIDHLTVSSKRLNSVLERITNYSRMVPSVVSALHDEDSIYGELSHQGGHHPTTYLARNLVVARKDEDPGATTSGSKGITFSAPLYAGIFQAGQKLDVSKGGTGGLVVEILLKPNVSVCFGSDAAAAVSLVQYEISDLQLSCPIYEMPTAGNQTSFSFNSITSVFQTINSSASVIALTPGLSRVSGVFMNMTNTSEIGNQAHNSCRLGNMGELRQVRFSQNGILRPLQYRLQTNEEVNNNLIQGGSLNFERDRNMVDRNYLEAVNVNSARDISATSLAHNKWWSGVRNRNQTANSGGKSIGTAQGIGILYDQFGTGENFSENVFSVEFELDGTTDNGLDGTAATSQGVYMFFLNKQTLIMDGSGISVQK